MSPIALHTVLHTVCIKLISKFWPKGMKREWSRSFVVNRLVQVLDENVSLTRFSEWWITLTPHDTDWFTLRWLDLGSTSLYSNLPMVGHWFWWHQNSSYPRHVLRRLAVGNWRRRIQVIFLWSYHDRHGLKELGQLKTDRSKWGHFWGVNYLVRISHKAWLQWHPGEGRPRKVRPSDS